MNKSREEIQEAKASFADMKDMMKKVITEKLQKLNPLTEEMSIFRVPHELRQVNNEAYSASVVSIGPLNHGNDTVKAMREYKWHYTQYFFQRMEDPQQRLEECTNAIYGLDAEVRQSYAEKMSCEADGLAEMMLVDGCFTLELFLRYAQYLNGTLTDKSDPIFNSAWMIPALRHDLALLENQIPFFILKFLYGVVKPHLRGEASYSAASLALKFLHPLSRKAIPDTADIECKHLLHLLYKFYFLPAAQDNLNSTVITIEQTNGEHEPADPLSIQVTGLTTEFDDSTDEITTLTTDLSENILLLPTMKGPSLCSLIYPVREVKTWAFKYSVSQLIDGHIKFEKGSTEDGLLNITFEQLRREVIIRIPPVSIDETTDSVFRNLIAFEQCSLKSRHHVTSYAILMKSLIRSSWDIKRLWNRGIIINHIGIQGQKLIWEKGIIINHNGIEGQEYWTHFQSMLDQVIVKYNNFYFANLCAQVNATTDRWYIKPIIFRTTNLVNQIRDKIISFYVSLLLTILTF